MYATTRLAMLWLDPELRFNVLHPMGWMLLVPTKNAAMERGVHPENGRLKILPMRTQLRSMGLSSVEREFSTCTPDYCRHE